MKSPGSVIKELLKWMLLAPLYAAGIAFGLVLALTSPLMIELLFDPEYFLEGASHQFKTMYIWIGIALIAGGYAILFAVAPAAFTGVAKVFIDRVVILPKPRQYLIFQF
jgi:hypothetical protein